MAGPGVETTPPWARHRRRAEALRARYPFAAEVLTLYLAVLDVWECGWRLTREERPRPRHLAVWTAERLSCRAVEATEAAGPEPLATAARELFEAGGLEKPFALWLAGGGLSPVERYLARVCLHAPLVALGEDAGAACADGSAPRGERCCPRCGGPPQLSFRRAGEDRLASGRRHLLCVRCGHAWSYSSSSCPSCAETSGALRTVYAERRTGPVVGSDGDEPEGTEVPPGGSPMFPHLRIDTCAACERYVIDVDLGRDPRAVPEVDELAALPLDLYAAEHGLSKITPNLMGF